MRIAFCDDNPKELTVYSDQIKKYIEQNGEPVEVMKYTAGEQLLFAFSDAQDAADLVFLDINMPEMNGIELAEHLRKSGYKKDIVFLTVSNKHFLPAFDVGAFNYLVKNETSRERFERVIQSAIKSVKRKSKAFMSLSAGGENRNIPILDILYFEVVNRLIVVHYEDETFEFFSTIGKLENKLQNYGFLRIHRSILVAKAFIRSFSYNEVTLSNGETLPISRGKYALLKAAMDEADNVC